jgi:nucleotide-binding universal stress UspA family protein
VSVRTILVGVDDSEGSRAALSWAADLAHGLQAKVVAVHVFEPLAHLGGGAAGGDLRALRDRARRELEQDLCRPLRERGLPFETRLVEGTPSEALADAAEEVQADLLVVGARRLGRLKELLLGSTSKALAERAQRPVAIVPLPHGAG